MAINALTPAMTQNPGNEYLFTRQVVNDFSVALLTSRDRLTQNRRQWEQAEQDLRGQHQTAQDQLANRRAAANNQLSNEKQNLDASQEARRQAAAREDEAARNAIRAEYDRKLQGVQAMVTQAAALRDSKDKQQKDKLEICLEAERAARNICEPEVYDKTVKGVKAANMQSFETTPFVEMRNEIRQKKEGILTNIFCAGQIKELCRQMHAEIGGARKVVKRLEKEHQAEFEAVEQEGARRRAAAQTAYDAAIARQRQAYQAKTNALAQQASRENAAHAQKVSDTAARFNGEKARLDAAQAEERRKFAADRQQKQEEFRRQVYHKLVNLDWPPALLKQYFDGVMARRVTCAGYQQPAQMPSHVFMGLLQTDARDLMGDPEGQRVSQVFHKNYPFIVRDSLLTVPLSLSLEGGFRFWIGHDRSQEARAAAALNGLCANILLSCPPGQVRFYPAALSDVAAFAPLAAFESDAVRGEHPRQLIPEGVLHSAADVEELLKKTVNYITDLAANLYGCASLQEYNAKNPMARKPVTVLALLGFPQNVTETAMNHLNTILRSGPKCGVYTIIAASDEQLASLRPETQKLAQNLMNEMDQFRLTENGLAWVQNGKVGKRSRLRLAAPPAMDQVNLVARTIHEAVQQAGRQKVYFDAICPKPQDWLKGSAGAGLSLPIGLFGASTVKRLVFNDSFVHALIVGKIGSGKSELIHTILAQALLNYAPEELQIYLVDFKSGVEAKIYADYCLPSFRAISVNSEPEFGLSVLKELEKEGERRAGLLKGKNYSNIREYNADPANADNKLPRILFVADEFHSMLKAPDGEMSRNCAQKLENIVRLYRSYGIHVLLASQEVSDLSDFSVTLSQIDTRVVLYTDEKEAAPLLNKGLEKLNMVEKGDPGAGVFSDNADGKDAHLFRAAWLKKEPRKALLEKLDTYYKAKGQKSEARVILSSVADSRSNMFQHFIHTGQIITQPGEIHLGESMSFRAGSFIRFEEKVGSHLLVLCGDEEKAQKAQDMLFFLCCSLMMGRMAAARAGRMGDEIYVCNLCEGQPMQLDDRLRELCLSFPGHFRYGSADQAGEMVEEVWQKLESRRTFGGATPPVWLVMAYADLADDLANPTRADLLRQLLEEGPKYGIHLVLWARGTDMLVNRFDLNPDLFHMKILLAMADAPYQALCGQKPDTRVKDGVSALFMQKNSPSRKIRPYDTPSRTWFEAFGRRVEEQGL